MSVGKNSINRVAEGAESTHSAPLTEETPSVAIEKAIVEGTAQGAEKKPAAKKPAAKKPAAKKTTAKKPASKHAIAPELDGQSVAAPAARRGRKPGSKNKKPAAKKATRIPRAPAIAKTLHGVSIGEELPVYLL